MKYSVITGIFGHRQVGKTTLSTGLAEKYITFDKLDSLSESSANPSGFLAKNQAHPLVIDECQLSPKLFPALKEWERTEKTPGQFLLTGSVRFSSRKAIRESLTGRIIAWELLPMDWAEQNNQKLSDSICEVLKHSDFEAALRPSVKFKQIDFQRYIENGGLPGVFAVRESSIVSQKFETQINTILERDLRLVIETTLDFKKLRQILVSLAKQHGQSFSISQISRETRVSQPTLRKIVSAFESMFLIRFIPTYGDFSKPVIFLEDMGERNHLVSELLTPKDSLLSFLYQNLRTQVFYRPENKIEIFNFKTERNLNIPLCFKINQKVLGLIPIDNEDTFDLAFESAQYFVSVFPHSKVLLVGRGIDQKRLAPKIFKTDVSALV